MSFYIIKYFDFKYLIIKLKKLNYKTIIFIGLNLSNIKSFSGIKPFLVHNINMFFAGVCVGLKMLLILLIILSVCQTINLAKPRIDQNIRCQSLFPISNLAGFGDS